LQKRSALFNEIEIIFSKTVAFPLIGLLISHITYPLEVFRHIRKYNVNNIVIYNFGSLNFIILCIVRLFVPRIKIWNNIEDISVFSFKDFKIKSEDNWLQQLFFSYSMKATAHLSDGYIVPTSRFFDYLPSKENKLVINGCIKVNDFTENKANDQVNILFAGKIAFEHGIKEFVDCLKIYNSENKQLNVNFNITGIGPKANWLKDELYEIKNINVNYHGFVTDKEYNDILNRSSICIALQKPDGRHANYKTPSKVYEYLGNSKLVIATNVGDFSEIGNNLIRICDPLNPENLKILIDDILDNKQNIGKNAQEVYHFALENYDYNNVAKKLQHLISGKLKN
jgi:glycosyltransferase involved in cell wall biosynthesis